MVEYNKIDLNWLRYAASIPISPGIHYSIVYREDFLRNAAGEAVYSIEAKILGRTMPAKEVTVEETVFFEYPSSPFQHWKFKHKDSWWLRWFSHRWPVIIAQQARICTLSAVWEMNKVYPEQSRFEYLGREHIVIEEPTYQSRSYLPGTQYRHGDESTP